MTPKHPNSKNPPETPSEALDQEGRAMTDSSTTDDGADGLKAPRQETDLYGEPVIEWGTENEYWEGYVPDNGDISDYGDRLMVAKYVEEDGDWVKTGMERAHITDIHGDAYNRRRGGDV